MWINLIECLESDLNIKNKLSYLNTVINVHGLNLVADTEISLVKTKVKEFCADFTKRTEGLLLLYAVVHCNSTLYVDNWSQIVLGSLQSHDVIIPKEIPLKIINKMLKSYGNDSSYDDVFSKVLNDAFPIILNPEDDKIYKLSCQTVAVCMKYAPVVTGIHMAGIEKLLLRELDNPYGEIVEAVGDCFAALPMCIAHVKRSAPSAYKDIWCAEFTKVINTVQSLLNNIMKLSEGQTDFKSVFGLPQLDIPAETSNTIVLADIFKNLCHCMAKMLSSEGCLVRVPITDLLCTLNRIYIIGKIIKTGDHEVSNLKLCFPQMLNGMYVVFEALILNFDIINQSQNFVKLMIMSLNTMEDTFSQSSSVNQVRGSTWKLIDVWLKQYGSKGSCFISKNKNIREEILKDVNIRENENVKSKQLNNSDINGKNQKANKVFACIHALKVLKSLVEVESMEKINLIKICSTLLGVAKVVLRHMLLKKHIPFPYSDENCRKMLFDSFFTYAICSDPVHSKYIMEAQNIFNAASRDTSAKVGRLCHRFRKLSRYYLNPRKPPPDVIQYSHASMLNADQPPVIENLKTEWGNGIEWNNSNGPFSGDDQMDDSEVTQVEGENAYSERSESDLVPIEQIDESDSRMNIEYRRIATQSSQSMDEEESIDDSDIEPTYVSTDSNPQRIGLNESSHINSFGMQSCAEQYANETRTERSVSEAVVPNLTNNGESSIEEHVSAFVEVKSAGQKPQQTPMGNGEWRKKENFNDTSDEESDMDEEGDEEGEANEEMSDNAADEASDGKRSPDFDEERPSKRQKCIDEEDDIDEEVEDEDVAVNNQSSDEEENEVNNRNAMGNNAGSTENFTEEESQGGNEDNDCKSPSINQMCNDFVCVEPSAPDIS